MPTLAQLKAKWFLPLTGDVLGVPQTRHTPEGSGPQLSVSTDGNTVVPLIDGQNYMTRWQAELTALTAGAGTELMHAGWLLQPVKPLGATSTGRDGLEEIDAAKAAGVAVYPLACRNLICVAPNTYAVDWLRVHGVWTACMDNRFPAGGSNHQKFAVFKNGASALALLGSIDISFRRWDRTAHAPADPDRHSLARDRPSHDTGIAISGPAVADVELTYRERWNDSTRTLGLDPPLPPQPLITTPVAAPAAGGTHSVQILRTYGITSKAFGFSWSPRGEFTVWASYLNAIRNATRYIYIEDQYFLAWDYPPRFARPAGPGRDVDIVYQLGEAMKRGVRVVVLTPSNAEDAGRIYQKFQRDIGVNYLTAIKAGGAPGDIVMASLRNSAGDVYVHSKLMLVDDELMLIGSTNIGQRSMCHDGELHAAVVDSADTLVKEFRKALWAEHTTRAAGTLDDPLAAYALFKTDVATPTHPRLHPYPVDPLSVHPPGPGTTPAPKGHPGAIRNVFDPYAGPASLA
jgi:phosphatidylserine/phosphatidylglycerophosphate/cardiolipin synthase-like enzyme